MTKLSASKILDTPTPLKHEVSSASTAIKRLNFFSKVTDTIASEIDLDRTLYAIVDEVYEYFKPRGASIMIKNGEVLQVVAGRSVTQKEGREGRPKDLPTFKIGEGVAGKAALLGKPVWVEDTSKGSDFYKIPGKESSIKAILAVPLKIRGRVTGVLNVAYGETKAFSEEDIDVLQIIAAPAAYAVQNAQLFREVEEERAKLEMIQESMQGGLTVSRIDGTVIFINEAAKKMFGLNKDIVGRPPFEIITHQREYIDYKVKLHFDVKDAIVSVVKGKTTRSRIELLSDPPRIIDALFSPLRSKEGKIIGIIGNYRDISEITSKASEVEAQLTIAEYERERWRAIYENVEEAIIIIDSDGTIRQANPASEIISGITSKDIVGRKVEEVFPLYNERGLSLSGELSPFLTVLTTKEKLEYTQAKFTNSEGREVWVGISLTPIKVSDGGDEDDQVVAVIRDISKLIEIDQAKSDFVSMASHELRTPLTVINGYISLVTSGDLGDINAPELANFKQVITQIQKNTERLNRLVEDLLNVSRIEQGRLELKFEKVNLELLIQEVVEDMMLHASTKNHLLKVVSTNRGFLDLPIIVNADYEKIKEVIINLVDNAIKYTPSEGQISVNVKRSTGDAIISVRDNGQGIPKQLIPRIFEKFQRLEGSYVKDTVGTGLGLYIVRELVRSHGGDVWVESKIGTGSIFSFSLPLK